MKAMTRTVLRQLLVAAVLVAGLLPSAASASAAAELSDNTVSGEGSSRCFDAAIAPIEIDEAIKLSVDPYRIRCEIEPVPDPRPGASYQLNVFVGYVCPKGQPDEFCLAKVGPHPVARTGAHAAEAGSLASVTPGTSIPIDVCIQFLICETVHVPLTFTLEIFDDGAQGELEMYVVGGGPTGLNPPKICTGVGSQCDRTVEDENPSTWLYF